jgi:hypothetical protein
MVEEEGTVMQVVYVPMSSPTVFDDPLMKALRDLRYMSDTQQDQLFAQKPYVQDLAEYMEDARDAIAEMLERYMDSPVRRFVDDVAIPTLTVLAVLTVDAFQPELIPASAPVLAAAAGRLAPVVGRVATAMGISVLYKETKDAVDGLAKSGTTPHSQSPYTPSIGQKLADGFKQYLNKLDNIRETVVYAIKERFTGKIMKYGETAAGYFKSEGMKDVLKRPFRQIQQAAKQGLGRLEYSEVAKFSTKKEARAYESKLIDQARAKDPRALPMNKGRH